MYKADTNYEKYKEELKSDINLAKEEKAQGRINEVQMRIKTIQEKVKTAKIEVKRGISSLREDRLKDLIQIEAEYERIDLEILNDELKSEINLALKNKAEGNMSNARNLLKNTLEKIKNAEMVVKENPSFLKDPRLRDLKYFEEECERIDQEMLKEHVKKKILELSNKYPRMQIEEIEEECGIQNQQFIIGIIKDMIQNKEIIAKHFSSTNSIIFERTNH